MIFKGLKFVLISSCSPEQYDVYKKDKQVGYIRLRYGTVTLRYPDSEGDLIYGKSYDTIYGQFPTRKERRKELRKIAKIINEEIKKQM